MAEVNINWLTVIVATVIAFILGAIWYSPWVFGKKWSEFVGQRPSPSTLGLSFAMTLFAAVLMAVIVGWTGAYSYRYGALVGVVGWTAFAGTAAVANMGFEPQRSPLTVINAVFQLGQFVFLGAAIGHFQ